eukprot:358859-Chlamydomonas_euryale.AAC.22
MLACLLACLHAGLRMAHEGTAVHAMTDSSRGRPCLQIPAIPCAYRVHYGAGYTRTRPSTTGRHCTACRRRLPPFAPHTPWQLSQPPTRTPGRRRALTAGRLRPPSSTRLPAVRRRRSRCRRRRRRATGGCAIAASRRRAARRLHGPRGPTCRAWRQLGGSLEPGFGRAKGDAAPRARETERSRVRRSGARSASARSRTLPAA